MLGMDTDLKPLETIGTILGPILGIAATIIPLFVKPSKARLRADLEILKLLSASDPNYQKVKIVVDDKIDELYKATKVNYIERIAYGLLGTMLMVGFGYWSYTLVVPEFKWWSVLTGYFSLIGAAYLLMAFVGRQKVFAKIGPRTR